VRGRAPSSALRSTAAPGLQVGRAPAIARAARRCAAWLAQQYRPPPQCGLTLPSNGHTTAGHNVPLRQGRSRRCVPLMSNVRPANTTGARFGIVCGRVIHRPSLGFVWHLGPAPSCRVERFKTDFMSRGGFPRSFCAQPARSTSKTCLQAPGSRQQRACKFSRRLPERRSPWVCVLRCHRTSGGARPESYKALLRQAHLGSSASVQSWLPRASLSCTLWLLMKDAALLQLVGSTAQCQRQLPDCFCRTAGLTLPSNGHTTAGHNVPLRQGWSRRCVPLMSNVRPANAEVRLGA